MKLLMAIGAIGSIYLSQCSDEIFTDLKSEFMIMVVGVLIGGMILVSANNMLSIYLGVETLSILSYVMASFRRNDERSSEAGLKYSLYGGIAAGIMLFGLSHLYGVLGTIQFAELGDKLKLLSTGEVLVLLPSFLMFFAGLGYKIACVPFHMWSPDVYEGSPLPVTTFFAIVPKLAGIAAILRVSLTFFSEEGLLQYSWVGILLVISVLTMTVGNVAAIGQKSIKRMLAYSSISHAGFMLMGVTVVDQSGVSAVAYYGLVYLFMTLLAFYIVGHVSNVYGNDDFDRFNGMVKRHPFVTILMTITMLSLAGVPPFGGFVAKFNLLAVVVNKKLYILAIIAGLNSVVSLYYYLKIVRCMVFNQPESTEQIPAFNMINVSILTIFVVPIFVLGIFWNDFFKLASEAHIFIP